MNNTVVASVLPSCRTTLLDSRSRLNTILHKFKANKVSPTASLSGLIYLTNEAPARFRISSRWCRHSLMEVACIILSVSKPRVELFERSLALFNITPEDGYLFGSQGGVNVALALMKTHDIRSIHSIVPCFALLALWLAKAGLSKGCKR